MKRQYATREADLVARLAEVLERDGWELFHSVRDPLSGILELDLCGVRMGESGEVVTLAVEAKGSLNLEVYDKAIYWRYLSTYVAVAVPWAKRTGIARAIDSLTKHEGIGRYIVAENYIITEAQPVKTSAGPRQVEMLAQAARASSKGLVVRGGSRAPRKATDIVLMAERAHAQLAQGKTESLEYMLPDSTPDERDAVAKFINGRCGRNLGLRARKFGNDFLIYSVRQKESV